jgi:hypothetical protein
MEKDRSTPKTSEPNEGRSWKRFFSFGEVGGYFFRKKDPNRPSNFNIRMMHGINKISIVIFLLGVLYLIYKLVIKPRL